jgi:hypothetical protein
MSEQGRRWLPADWLDEMNPTMLATPDAYIERAGDGWSLRLPEGDDDRDNEFYRMSIEPGQIVQFLHTDGYGDVNVVVNADGSWTSDREPDPRANTFYEWSSGVLASSLKEMVEGDPEMPSYNPPLEPGEYKISAYSWSDPISFQFIVTGDRGHFDMCAGVN